MMNSGCGTISLDLPAYARGRLDPAGAVVVEGHVRECDICRAELEQLRRLERVLEDHLPALTPSASFASTFANRLAAEVLAEEEPTPERGFFAWRFRPWLVPLAVAAVLAAIVVQQSMPPSPEAPTVARVAEPPAAELARKLPEAPAVARAPEVPARRDEGTQLAAPPREVLERLDLFMDYAVIETLDTLETSEKAG